MICAYTCVYICIYICNIFSEIIISLSNHVDVDSTDIQADLLFCLQVCTVSPSGITSCVGRPRQPVLWQRKDVRPISRVYKPTVGAQHACATRKTFDREITFKLKLEVMIQWREQKLFQFSGSGQEKGGSDMPRKSIMPHFGNFTECYQSEFPGVSGPCRSADVMYNG